MVITPTLKKFRIMKQLLWKERPQNEHRYSQTSQTRKKELEAANQRAEAKARLKEMDC